MKLVMALALALLVCLPLQAAAFKLRDGALLFGEEQRRDEEGIWIKLKITNSVEHLSWDQLDPSYKPAPSVAKPQPAVAEVSPEVESVQTEEESAKIDPNLAFPDVMSKRWLFITTEGQRITGVLERENKTHFHVATPQGVLYIKRTDVREHSIVYFPAETILKTSPLYRAVIAKRRPTSAEDHFSLGRGFAKLGMADEARLHYRRGELADPARHAEAEELVRSLDTGSSGPDQLAWAKTQIARGRGWAVVEHLRKKMETEADPTEKERIASALTRAEAARDREAVRLYYRRIERQIRDIYNKYSSLRSNQLASMLVAARLYLQSEVVNSIAEDLKIEPQHVVMLWKERSAQTPREADYGWGGWLAEIVDRDEVVYPEFEGDEESEEGEEAEEESSEDELDLFAETEGDEEDAEAADSEEDRFKREVEGLQREIAKLATEAEVDPVKQWKLLNRRGRTNLLTALVVEEQLTIQKRKSKKCIECAGTGLKRTLTAENGGGIEKSRCPKCLGSKVFTSVMYN